MLHLINTTWRDVGDYVYTTVGHFEGQIRTFLENEDFIQSYNAQFENFEDFESLKLISKDDLREKEPISSKNLIPPDSNTPGEDDPELDDCK